MGTRRFLDLETNERKNISLLMMFGGAFVFTVFAGIGLWLVAANLKYVFYLAIIAHVQIFTIMTGFIAQLVKRRISVGKGGIGISDEGMGELVEPEKEEEPLEKEKELGPF